MHKLKTIIGRDEGYSPKRKDETNDFLSENGSFFFFSPLKKTKTKYTLSMFLLSLEIVNLKEKRLGTRHPQWAYSSSFCDDSPIGRKFTACAAKE